MQAVCLPVTDLNITSSKLVMKADPWLFILTVNGSLKRQ